MSEVASPSDGAAVAARIAALEAALAAEHALRVAVEAERDRIRAAYEALRLDVELTRRRLLIAKAERIDTTQLELEFAGKLAALDALAGQATPDPDKPEEDGEAKPGKPAKRNKPTGRRDLRLFELPEERIEVTDPVLEGKAQRIGAEESCELRWRRGGFVRVVVARIKYSTTRADKAVADAAGSTTLDGAAAATGDSREAADITLVTTDSSEAVAMTRSVLAAEHAPAAVTMVGACISDLSTPADATTATDAAAKTAATSDSNATLKVDGAPVEDAAVVAALEAAGFTASTSTACPVQQLLTEVGQEMPGVVTAAMPPRLLQRSIATPSLLAHIASDKFCDGLPLHRQEDRFARLGVRLDRGTMGRWLEEAGATAGATIVEAMRREAMRTAFCIATDATGVLVQPMRRDDRQRQSCRRAHFFVQIADADHVFFEYTPRETGAVVGQMFRGFSGFVQADAKNVYDILFRPPHERERSPHDDADPSIRHEVGCWSHARRKFWEAAVATQDVVAREALARIMRMFVLERSWQGCSPDEKMVHRNLHLRPHLVEFFKFVEPEYERVKAQRGLLRTALGYAVRQRDALMRFLDDGRLEMTNNRSERQLRRIATGRNAWLFVGSDDHGQAAGNLFTLIASARLHKLDPEVYLRDVFRVLPLWPRDRYIELAPRYWSTTRARLDPSELDLEIGWLTIPEPPLPTP